MADDVKIIRIQIDASRAVDGGKAAQRALEDIEKSTGSVSRAVSAMESAFRSLFAGYLGLQGLRMLAETADAMTRFTNSLTASGVAARDLTDVQDRLFAAANKHGIEIGAVGQLYSRLSMSSQELGASQGQMLKFVDGVTAALRVQGGTTEQASGALLQLPQAMGAGTVRAEEFTSILEGALPIAQAAARGIDGMEGSVAKLRAAVSSGKVSSQEFFQGLLRGFGETEKIAESTQMTMGAAATGMQNSWSRLIAEFDKTAGTSKMVVQGLQNISGALDALRKGTSETAQAWDNTTLDRLQGRIAEVQGRIDRLNARGTGGTLRQAELNRELAHMAELQRALADFKTTAQQPPQPGGGYGYGGPEPAPGTITFPPPDPTKTGGGSVASTRAQVDQIAEIIKRAEEEAQRLKDAFGQGTEALIEQNEVLAAELKLLGAAPDVRARELAIIQATNDAKKAGYGTESEAYKARLAALETGEKLRMQQDELKRAQELWTEPLKQALRDIQSTAADAFDSMLESGNFSFEELGKTFGRIVRRMAAEFLALATIRPIMSIAVQAVAPGMAREMGLSGNPFGGIGGSSSGGGGLSGLSMPSWLGGGQPFGFLNQSIPGTNLGSFAGIDAEIANWSTYGTAAQNSLGGISWGAGLGALAGAGMGIYQLASGNGSASSTIGGISSIVGAGLSLIPGIGPFLGAGVSLLGNMLPGLFGMDKPPVINNQTYGQLTYGANGWYTTGGAWGPSANSGDTERGLKSLGGGISSVFDMLGGVRDPSKVWGLSAMNHTVSGQGWSSSSDSTYLVDPNGNQQLWRMNESNMMDTGSAQVAYRSILEGAVGAISELMRQRVTDVGQTMGGTSLQAIAEVINEVQSFEKAMASLGKTSVGAEQALQAINDGLGSLWAYAKEHALDADVRKIETYKEEQIIAGAKAFMAPYDAANDNPLVAGLDQLGKARDAALKEAGVWNAALGTRPDLNVEQYFIDMNRITEYYLKAEKDLKEQYYRSTFGGLQDLVKSLTYGSLSNASPQTALDGAQGAWNSAMAAALGGDRNALASLAGLGNELGSVGQRFYGASAAGVAFRSDLLADINSVAAANGATITSTGITAADTGAIAQGIGVMSQQLAQIADNTELDEQARAELTSALNNLADKIDRLIQKVG